MQYDVNSLEMAPLFQIGRTRLFVPDIGTLAFYGFADVGFLILLVVFVPSDLPCTTMLVK